MKSFIFLFYLFLCKCTFAVNGISMNLKIEILNKNSLLKPLYLEIFGYTGEKGTELLLSKILLKKNNEQVIIPLQYAMRGFFQISNDDSLLAASSVIYLNDETISLSFNIRGLINVNSKQNQFKQLNENLLFAVPALIKNSKEFSIDKVKNTYNNNFTGNYYLQKYIEEYEALVIRQVKEYRNYYHCLFSLSQSRLNISSKTLDTCLAILSHFKGKTFDYDKLFAYNSSCKSTIVGAAFPSFFASDITENKITSDKMTGANEFILFEFWASWCIPCRKSFKEIKKIYDRIDTTKFQIVTISLDEEKFNWLKALKTDSISWPSFIDTTGQSGYVSKLFALDFIPQNILINKEGYIINKNVSIEELMEFIKVKNLLISKH